MRRATLLTAIGVLLLFLVTSGVSLAQEGGQTPQGESSQANGNDAVQPRAGILCKDTGTTTCKGTRRDDQIVGTDSADTINAKAGDDSVIGSDGDDTIDGGNGDDALGGGSDDDTIRDTNPRDRDVISGGDGDDLVDVADDDKRDTVDCGSGSDRVRADRGDEVNKANCETIDRR